MSTNRSIVSTNRSVAKCRNVCLSVLMGIGVFLFWWLWHPEALSFQEQNQLFLWTGNYLAERLSTSGGLADWLGEFIVQFFYVEWLGALLMALLFVLMYWLSVKAIFSPPYRVGLGVGLLFPLFFLWLMGDENVLVALPVAFTLVLAAVALMRRVRKVWWLPIAVALWWAVGMSWTTYYRIPQHGPDFSGWNGDKWELLKQDYLIRHERWDNIIERAKMHEVQTPFWSNSVNLALAMKGQLADKMFDYWQSGEDALLMPMVRDNVSNLPTAEAFWRLGMVNEALRYMSDIQESILNARKSGRFEQRIVECMLVNGKYRVAYKHIQLLKKSLFYASWAEDAERYLTGQRSPLIAPLTAKRALRFKQNFLFNYPEIDKMLSILFQENTQNKMALEYFLGQLLLKGDAQTFMQALPLAQQHGGYRVMPMVYQDAVSCMQSRSVPDTPYGRYIKRKMGGR